MANRKSHKVQNESLHIAMNLRKHEAIGGIAYAWYWLRHGTIDANAREKVRMLKPAIDAMPWPSHSFVPPTADASLKG